MIEPISLRMTGEYIVVTNNLTCCGEQPDLKQPVEACIIDSGRLKGQVIAYVRYCKGKLDSADDLWVEEYPWQVIKVSHGNNIHYSTTKTLEQALHLVMACAYEYVAFN